MSTLESTTQGLRLAVIAAIGVAIIAVALVVGINHRNTNDVAAGCKRIAANRMTYEDARMVGMTYEYQQQNALLAECRSKGFID